VWLPSPMGDAVLCTPALRALGQRFGRQRVTLLGNSVVREVLTPCDFADRWLAAERVNPFVAAFRLRRYKFTCVVLFKNSFASALASAMAQISVRVGYARQGRGFLLTERLYAPMVSWRRYKVLSMVDYYLAAASWLGAETSDRRIELGVGQEDRAALLEKMPQVAGADGPVVILVPGGAFGPSKWWPGRRYAETADWLIDRCGARVVLSVASNAAERQIAEGICAASRHRLINVEGFGLSLGQLKALYSLADLVITNDTGPRHIAIALGRKVITLFGPNDPAWTDTGYEKEIQIVGAAACGPCHKPVCRQREHYCMEAITVERVCKAAEQLLYGRGRGAVL